MDRMKRWERNCSVLKDRRFRNNYSIELDIIGEGSFGTVISAKCKKTTEKRAIKAIRRIDKVSMLSIELQLLAELGGHFNIVKFYDFFHVLGSVAIVMEHFPHCSVTELVMISRRDPTFPLLYYRNLLIAVNYLHQNGFVHRDVKLSNFLYSPQQNAFRLVDFGLATVDRSENEKTRAECFRNLEEYKECSQCSRQIYPCMFCKAKPKRDQYHVVGTPGVRAPELLFGIGVSSPPIDIFSAGLCLLSLVALKHPFFSPQSETENIQNLACLLGTKTLEMMAELEGLRVTMSDERPPADIGKLILCLRFGFDSVHRFKHLLEVKKCQICAQFSYNNENAVCFCRPDYKTNIFSTAGINNELLILYIDLIHHSLEPDRFKRYNANQLLGIIDFYDSRANFVPKPFTNPE